ITDRVSALPMLGRRLDLRRGRWPRWLPAEDIAPSDHLRTRTVGSTHGVSLSTAVREFLTTPAPLDRPPCQLELLHDPAVPRPVLPANLHHPRGDGLAVTAPLLALLSDQPSPRVQRAGWGTTWANNPVQPAERGTSPWVARLARARRVARGVVSLAAEGPAP